MAVATVVARSLDRVTAWPIGLAVQAYLEEKLVLAANAGQLLFASRLEAGAPSTSEGMGSRNALPMSRLEAGAPSAIYQLRGLLARLRAA